MLITVTDTDDADVLGIAGVVLKLKSTGHIDTLNERALTGFLKHTVTVGLVCVVIGNVAVLITDQSCILTGLCFTAPVFIALDVKHDRHIHLDTEHTENLGAGQFLGVHVSREVACCQLGGHLEVVEHVLNFEVAEGLRTETCDTLQVFAQVNLTDLVR